MPYAVIKRIAWQKYVIEMKIIQHNYLNMYKSHEIFCISNVWHDCVCVPEIPSNNKMNKMEELTF